MLAIYSLHFINLYHFITVQAMLKILNNVFCHTLLQRMLPNLRNLLHDTSEKVRLSYLKLMYKISYINGFKVSECKLNISHILILNCCF